MKDKHHIRALFVSDDSSGVFSATRAFADFFSSAQLDDFEFRLSVAGVSVLNELQEAASDCAIYSRENTPRAACLDQIAQVFPGIQLLHEASFDAMFLEKHLGNAFPEALRKELRERFQQDLDILADTFVRGWSAHALRRSLRWKSILDESEGVRLVSSPGLLRFYPDAKVCPIPIALIPVVADREKLFAELGFDLSKKVIVFTATGSRVSEEFLINDIGRELGRKGLEVNVLVLRDQAFSGQASTGQASSGQFSPGQDISGERVNGAVIAQVTDVADIFRYLSIADYYLSLGAEEFSGISPNLLRAMGMGIPGIVSGTRMNHSIPSQTVMKIRPGFSEVNDAVDAILALEKDFLRRSELSSRARELVRSQHSYREVTRHLLPLLQELLPGVIQKSEARRESARRSRESLLESLRVSLSATDPWLSAHYSNAFSQAARELGW